MSCSCKGCEVNNAAWVEKTLIKYIKCLCSCSGSGEVPNCVPTFLTGKEIDGYPEYITYSKNGGPFKEIAIFDIEPNNLPAVVNMFKDENLSGFAFSILDSFYPDTDNIIEFCGLSSDGSFITSIQSGGIKPTELHMPNGDYIGPFNIKTAKNTLTFKPTDTVSGHRDFFYCLNNPTEAETLTIESCAILEVIADPLPQPT